ncbi:MAG TPA: PP0621 family protein [Burkholderiales bacterium]|nr:PP0621 family protein [Burkholderiales bacterium]
MARLILFAIAVYALVWLLRRAVERPEHDGRPQRPPRARPARPEVDELVRCAQCGVHLPRAEARTVSGRLYCGDEHARLGPRED